MLDPIPPPAPWLSAAVQPFADAVGLHALPDHIHELLFAVTVYTAIQVLISPVLSTYLFPDIYPKLAPRTKINWDVHVVSLVQSTLINALALWVILTDQERKDMNALERIYGYTSACGMIGALGAGYFLWDLVVSVRYFKLFGAGVLAHAVAALCVFSAGSRPYLQYYGSTFILYELSSPFLNIHWFCDKLGMTGSRLQWYNGILLLVSFAGCRLLWGTWQSVKVYQDIWVALQVPESVSISDAIAALGVKSAVSDKILIPTNGQCELGDPTCISAQSEILRYMKYAKHLPVPLAFSTVASNLILNSLNLFWYTKMIKTVKSRFEGKEDPNADKNDVIIEGVQLGAEVLDKKTPEGKGEITGDGLGQASGIAGKPKANRRKG